ncbi:hypothetical protein C8F01DRAFT_1342929 [Mycena amicta]|nr:hypothetical protein C8F01DRAFT_1342929 [Mycena amicta]
MGMGTAMATASTLSSHRATEQPLSRHTYPTPLHPHRWSLLHSAVAGAASSHTSHLLSSSTRSRSFSSGGRFGSTFEDDELVDPDDELYDAHYGSYTQYRGRPTAGAPDLSRSRSRRRRLRAMATTLTENTTRSTFLRDVVLDDGPGSSGSASAWVAGIENETWSELRSRGGSIGNFTIQVPLFRPARQSIATNEKLCDCDPAAMHSSRQHIGRSSAMPPYKSTALSLRHGDIANAELDGPAFGFFVKTGLHLVRYIRQSTSGLSDEVTFVVGANVDAGSIPLIVHAIVFSETAIRRTRCVALTFADSAPARALSIRRAATNEPPTPFPSPSSATFAVPSDSRVLVLNPLWIGIHRYRQ